MQSYKKLNDAAIYRPNLKQLADEKTTVEVWYTDPGKQPAQRNLRMGSEFCREHGAELPTLATVNQFCRHLGTVGIDSNEYVCDELNRLVTSLQGENWSPNGEARELIKSLKLGHTSMSIGDCFVVRRFSPYHCWSGLFMLDCYGSLAHLDSEEVSG